MKPPTDIIPRSAYIDSVRPFIGKNIIKVILVLMVMMSSL